MNRKILIVDDEKRTLMLMERTLRDLEDEHEEVEILTASNGEEALETIKADKPAIVFLDIMMPIIDGFDVCNIVKNELGMDDVYIVMLTAKGQEVDRQRSVEVGADLYLTKPFDPDKVFSIAREALGL
ncbi:MAG: response regulator [Anaerolineaceae bacterium]|nr:MAG: response regulator [Anaerolineaceae bacterium]